MKVKVKVIVDVDGERVDKGVLKQEVGNRDDVVRLTRSVLQHVGRLELRAYEAIP